MDIKEHIIDKYYENTLVNNKYNIESVPKIHIILIL